MDRPDPVYDQLEEVESMKVISISHLSEQLKPTQLNSKTVIIAIFPISTRANTK